MIMVLMANKLPPVPINFVVEGLEDTHLEEIIDTRTCSKHKKKKKKKKKEQ